METNEQTAPQPQQTDFFADMTRLTTDDIAAKLNAPASRKRWNEDVQWQAPPLTTPETDTLPLRRTGMLGVTRHMESALLQRQADLFTTFYQAIRQSMDEAFARAILDATNDGRAYVTQTTPFFCRPAPPFPNHFEYGRRALILLLNVEEATVGDYVRMPPHLVRPNGWQTNPKERPFEKTYEREVDGARWQFNFVGPLPKHFRNPAVSNPPTLIFERVQ